MYRADEMLRDLMMIRGDRNGDNKLSASEITWFYRYFVHYPEFVAKTYGERFISLADQNGDGLLDDPGKTFENILIIFFFKKITQRNTVFKVFEFKIFI